MTTETSLLSAEQAVLSGTARSSSVSKMASSFLEAATTLAPQFPSSRDRMVQKSSNSSTNRSVASSTRSESSSSFGSLIGEDQKHFKEVCSSGNCHEGSNSSTVTAQTLSMQFYKTRMCPFAAKGLCTKGDACTYAHDKSELKTAPDLYKTKLCEIWQKGHCENLHCRFAHGRQELRSTNMVYKTRICHFWATGDCNKGSLCRHAHGNDELRSDSSGSQQLSRWLSTDTTSSRSNSMMVKQNSLETKLEKGSVRTSSQKLESTEDLTTNASSYKGSDISPRLAPLCTKEEMFVNQKHSFVNDDNWRIPSSFKEQVNDGHQIWDVPKSIIGSPLLSPPETTQPNPSPIPEVMTTIMPDRFNNTTGAKTALDMLNVALCALNLKGEAARQATKLKQLIINAVPGGENSVQFSSSQRIVSVNSTKPVTEGRFNHQGKEWNRSCESTDVDSAWTPIYRETPESSPRYSRTPSMPDPSKGNGTVNVGIVNSPRLMCSRSKIPSPVENTVTDILENIESFELNRMQSVSKEYPQSIKSQQLAIEFNNLLSHEWEDIRDADKRVDVNGATSSKVSTSNISRRNLENTQKRHTKSAPFVVGNHKADTPSAQPFADSICATLRTVLQQFLLEQDQNSSAINLNATESNAPPGLTPSDFLKCAWSSANESSSHNTNTDSTPSISSFESHPSVNVDEFLQLLMQV